MPPNFSSRCWAALCQKWPDLASRDEQTALQIIEGNYQAFNRVKPDAVNGIPPTLEQLKSYFSELSSACDPQHFLDFYDARGWIIGSSKSKMKDWRAAARLWARNAGIQPKTTAGTASLFSLQAQLKYVEQELNDIIYPGGTAFKTMPTGGKLGRYHVLMAQRRGLISKIDAFSQ